MSVISYIYSPSVFTWPVSLFESSSVVIFSSISLSIIVSIVISSFADFFSIIDNCIFSLQLLILFFSTALIVVLNKLSSPTVILITTPAKISNNIIVTTKEIRDIPPIEFYAQLLIPLSYFYFFHCTFVFIAPPNIICKKNKQKDK